MNTYLNKLRDMTPYKAAKEDRDSLMLSGLNELTQHHYQSCQPYKRIIDGMWQGSDAVNVKYIEDVPYLPVSLFKSTRLSSIDDDEIALTLTSSGTTGQRVSEIVVDKHTSTEQQKCLANSMSHVLGSKRIPMLVIDTESVFKNPALMSARGAGVLGMMRFGYRPVFMIDEFGGPNFEQVDDFLKLYGDKPFFIFGFTYMIWSQLYEVFKNKSLNLKNGILIHSGGWKKMEDIAVDAEVFRKKLYQAFQLEHMHNFYGMVEQIGSIFLEGDDGLLYPPNFSDVIIRDVTSWEPCDVGQEGLIQVLSLIPRSYPGHSLLTEDIGVVEKITTNGQFRGKGIKILGRLEKAELRGCSDIIATEAASTQ